MEDENTNINISNNIEIDSIDPGNCTDIDPTVIKHIVISGGGYYGFNSYGLLEESNKRGLWDMKNIKSMHGTSVGAIICVFLCLKYDWEILDKYLINRPWDQVFNVDMYSVINIFHQNGLFQIECFKQAFYPLFNGMDEPISIDITLSEFYAYTGIDLYIYCTDLNSFEKIVLSHKTHPDFGLIDAIYSSSSVPIIFSPIIKNNQCYIDGFFHVHYPIEDCLKITENHDEVLGVCTYMFSNSKDLIDENHTNLTFLDYIMHVFVKMFRMVTRVEECIANNKIKHQFVINTEYMSINEIIELISCEKRRASMIHKGRDFFYSLQSTIHKLL